MKPVTEPKQQINHAETGKLVREMREAKGISLRQLAKQMDVSAPFLSDMERGRRNWTTARFEQAERAINKPKPINPLTK